MTLFDTFKKYDSRENLKFIILNKFELGLE